jgi:hypothetical protein
MAEIACRELRSDAAQEEDELRVLEASFDLELAESKHLPPAIERLLAEELS